MWVRIPGKNINFASLKSFYHRLANTKNLILPNSEIFQNFEGCNHLALQTHNLCHLQFFNLGNIDFTDEAVVQCDIPVAKILF